MGTAITLPLSRIYSEPVRIWLKSLLDAGHCSRCRFLGHKSPRCRCGDNGGAKRPLFVAADSFDWKIQTIRKQLNPFIALGGTADDPC